MKKTSQPEMTTYIWRAAPRQANTGKCRAGETHRVDVRDDAIDARVLQLRQLPHGYDGRGRGEAPQAQRLARTPRDKA